MDAPPKLDHFHLSDLQGLSDRAHWKKVAALIEVINDKELNLRGDLQLIYTEPYKAHFRGRMTATYDQPFHMAYVTIFQQVALNLSDPDGVIDWVFDEMDDTQYLELLDSYRNFKRVFPDPEIVRRLGEEPIRRDDKKVLPLQAADLWTGLMRRSCGGDTRAQAHLMKITIPNFCVVWDETTIAQLWRKNVELTPSLATGRLYEGKKQRSERLSEARKGLRLRPK